jgi:cytosine permease
MAADYLLAGKKWPGPREGVNMAGYLAWAAGFIVGVLPWLVPEEYKTYTQPAVLYSFLIGFLVYTLLAKGGMEPKLVPVGEPLPVRRAKAQA